MKTHILSALLALTLCGTAFSAAATRTIPRAVPDVSDLANESGYSFWQEIFVRDENQGGWFTAVSTNTVATVAPWTTDAPGTDVTGMAVTDSSGDFKWVRQWDGPASVKWFGAKGDGTTDDRAAIVRAIESDIGVPIRFPTGTYRSAAAIHKLSASGVHLIGDGPQNTVIFFDFQGQTNAVEDSELSRGLRWKDNTVTSTVYGPRIEGIYFHGDTNAASLNRPHRLISTSLVDQRDVHIENCWFSHSGNGALELGLPTSRGVTLRDLYIFDDMRFTNIVSSGSGSIGGAGTDWYINNVTITNAGCTVTHTSANHSTYIVVDNVVIDGMRFFGSTGDGGADADNDGDSWPDLRIQGDGATVSGLYIYGVGDQVIVYGGSNIRTFGAVIENEGVLKLSGSSDIAFYGLTYNCPSETSGAISLASAPQDNILFSGCSFTTGGPLATMSANGSNLRVVDCVVDSGTTSTALFGVSGWTGLELRNSVFTIVGASGGEFIRTSSGFTDGNFLLENNTFTWTSAATASLFDFRNPAATDIVLRNNRVVASAASVFNLDSNTGGTMIDNEDLDVTLSTGTEKYVWVLTPAAGVLEPSILRREATVDMGGDLTLSNLTNLAQGRTLSLRIYNDQATNCVLTLDGDWHHYGEVSPITVPNGDYIRAMLEAFGDADTDVDVVTRLKNN